MLWRHEIFFCFERCLFLKCSSILFPAAILWNWKHILFLGPCSPKICFHQDFNLWHCNHYSQQKNKHNWCKYTFYTRIFSKVYRTVLHDFFIVKIRGIIYLNTFVPMEVEIIGVLATWLEKGKDISSNYLPLVCRGIAFTNLVTYPYQVHIKDVTFLILFLYLLKTYYARGAERRMISLSTTPFRKTHRNRRLQWNRSKDSIIFCFLFILNWYSNVNLLDSMFKINYTNEKDNMH